MEIKLTEKQFRRLLDLVILADAVVAPGGVEHPVADVYQVQQAPV